MGEIRDMLIMTVIGVIIILTLIVSMAVAPTYLFERASCSAKAEAQGYKYEFGMFKGCMVKTDKGWMDYNRLIYKKDAE